MINFSRIKPENVLYSRVKHSNNIELILDNVNNIRIYKEETKSIYFASDDIVTAVLNFLHLLTPAT